MERTIIEVPAIEESKEMAEYITLGRFIDRGIMLDADTLLRFEELRIKYGGLGI